MDEERKMFGLGILITAILAGLLSLIPLWQLVIIAGIVGGYFNVKMKKSILSGALGTLIFWGIYVTYFIITINAYVILDQIGALFISKGFGWLILLLILGMGTLFGALGGALGYYIRILRGKKPSVEEPNLEK